MRKLGWITTTLSVISQCQIIFSFIVSCIENSILGNNYINNLINYVILMNKFASKYRYYPQLNVSTWII